MRGLLLGTDALQAFLADDATLHGWLSTQVLPLHAATVSIASLLASAEQMTNVTQRRLWSEKLGDEVPRRFGPKLQAFDLAAAKVWSALYVEMVAASAGTEATLIPEGELFVIAIAMAEDLDYIEARADWHGAISGLRQFDPWSSSRFPA